MKKKLQLAPIKSATNALFVSIFFFAVNARAQEETANEDVENTSEEEQEGEADDESPSEKEPEKKKKEEKSWTDYIKFNGDFRYRVELIADDEKDTRHRHRIRGRLGAIGTIGHGLSVGIQIATGEGAGHTGDPVSSNQTLSKSFSSKPIWLDLAYAAWHPEFAEGLGLVAGKMKNPFFTVQKSELLWDPDLNPEGIALGYKREFGMFEPFIQTGGFFVEERQEDPESWILGAQAGLKSTFGDGIFHILGGVGYIDYTAIKGNLVYFDSTDSAGNSSAEVIVPDPDPNEDPNLIYINDYNLVEGFLEIGGKIWKFPWAVFGSIVGNTAASDDGLGWLAGVSFAKCKESLDFCLRYIYREVQKDAVVGAFTDSDFIGGGTDGKGHEWNAGFQIVKGLKFGTTYFYNQKGLGDTTDFHRAQFDFKLKF